MNKKLFSWKALAGFALLAAISMTSCNTDDPINPTNPSGVNPTASSHYVGGDYDWTAIAKNLTELQSFWNADKADVAKLLKDSKAKTANILLDVSGFELDNATIFTLPDFWGTGAKGNVVNITFRGNFKKADYQRASAIAGDGKAFPVKIVTDNLAGAEVNFTFDAEKIDLELSSKLTRSTLSGDYKIGYMKADAAEKLSALEVKSGTVEGLDVESTGDFKGTFGGAWTKTDFNPIRANGSGIYMVSAGSTTSKVIPGAKNLFVEKDADLNTWFYNNGWKEYALGKVKFVQKAKTNATIYMAYFVGGNPTPYSIESIEGIGAKYSFIQVASATLDNVESVKNVTINGNPTLTQDVFTDVIFANSITLNTKNITSFDKVTFNGLTIKVADDNQTLEFNGVNFNSTPVAMRSGITLENTTAYTLYDYYQWVVSDTDPTQGQWVMYKTDHTWYTLTDAQKEVKEYNKNKDVEEYSDQDVYLDSWDAILSQPCGQLQKNYGSSADLSKATNLIKIGDYYPAGTIEVIPEGTKIAFDADCTFGGAKTDAKLNTAFGDKTDSKECWYGVTYGDNVYNWRRIQKSGTYVYWSLVPVK